MKNLWRTNSGSVGYDSVIAMLEMTCMRGSWHGKNIVSAIKGLDAETAHRTVPHQSKTIWQIVVHCAYWCYRVRMMITGQKGRDFPRKGSDWLPQPDTPDPDQWEADKQLLLDEYTKILDVVAEMRDGEREPAVDAQKFEYLVTGIAFHAIYHASQITQFRKQLTFA